MCASRASTAVPGWAGRLGWLALYWLMGVGAMGLCALGLRVLMRLAGLTV